MLYGFIDKKFCPVIPAQFDEAQSFFRGSALVLKNKKWGTINASSKYLLNPGYYDERPVMTEKGRIMALRSGINYIYRNSGSLIKKCEYDFLLCTKDGFTVFCEGGKHGLMDRKFKVTIQPQYDDLWYVSEDRIAFKSGKLWGYLDYRGNVVIEPSFDSAFDFCGGLAKVNVGRGSRSTYGLINNMGKYVIPPVLTGLDDFHEDLAAAEIDGGVGFINRTGSFIFPNEYQDARVFSEGMAAVCRGGISHFQVQRKILAAIDSAFDRINESIKDLQQTVEEMARIEENEEIIKELPAGCFTGTRCAIVPEKKEHDRTMVPKEELQPVDEDKPGLWGHIDRTNKIIVPIEYKSVGSFNMDMVYVTDGQSFGYYDKKGKLKIPLKYEEAGPFSDGLARAKIDGLWGFINRKGKWLAKPVYQEAKDFDNGLALVQLNGRWGMIDKEGREVLPPIYDYLENYSEGMAKMGYN